MRYGNNKPKYIRWAIYVLISAVAVLLQNSAGHFLKPGSARIFFAVCIAVCVAVFEREIASSLIGAFTGILLDISCGADGFNAVLFVVLCAVCSLLISHFMRNNYITALVLGTGSLLVYEIVYIIINYAGAGLSLGAILSFYLPSLLLSVLIIPICYEIVRLVYAAFKTADE